MLSAQHAGTEKLISGQLKLVHLMKQKPNSSDAQNASIHGESIDKLFFNNDLIIYRRVEFRDKLFFNYS